VISGFSGGYLGISVFFTVGYLITSLADRRGA